MRDGGELERARALLDRGGGEEEALALATRHHEVSGGTDPDTWLLLAEIYFALDRDERARNSARCARLFAKAGSTGEADALMWEAKALISQDEPREAIARASHALEIDASCAERYEVLARALALLHRFGEAAQVCTEGRIVFPRDEDLADLEEVIFEGLDAAEAEAAAAARAVKRKPKAWEAHHELAVLQLCAGNVRAAARSFERARALHPERLSAVTMLSTWEADCRLAVLTAARA